MKAQEPKTKSDSNIDPSIDAIYKKRAPFIENLYNKNLRPVIDFHEANNPSSVNTNILKTPDQLRSDTAAKQNSMTLSTQPTKLSLKNDNSTLFREGTTLSVSSFFNDLQTPENMNLNEKILITDGGVKIYEVTCRELKLVPCSIVNKSLPTTCISLSGYGLGPNGTLALSAALKVNLTVVKLDLSSNSVGALGMKYLAKMFDENSTITELNLSQNEIRSEGVIHLLDLFKRNHFIRDLDLSENEFMDEDGVLLAEGLEEQHLTRLNLSHNEFSERAGIAFGKWISDNHILTELDLSWNHIRKKGALQLAKGISENNKILRLNISWNGFENNGAEAIGKALTHNVMLQELDIKCNRIGPQGFAKICTAFKDNTSLKKLYIGKNHVTQEVLETVFKQFININSFSLELLDVSEVSLRPSINDAISLVKNTHPKFSCIYGFLNTGEKKIHNANEEALSYINAYCADNNISLMDLFTKLDSDGSMTVSYDEFKAGLKKAKVPISAAQIDNLIKYLDKDGDGEIDFSELIIGEEKARLSKGK